MDSASETPVPESSIANSTFQTTYGATRSLEWQNPETFISTVYFDIDMLARTGDWGTCKDIKDSIRNIVHALTIESKLLKDDLCKDMVDRSNDYQSGFSRVMQYGGNPDLAAEVMEAAFSRMLKRQIREQYMRPMHDQLVIEHKPDLTVFEGYFIPILFTDEIQGGLGLGRRTLWKTLETEQEQLDHLMQILELVRKGTYAAPHFNQVEKAEAMSPCVLFEV